MADELYKIDRGILERGIEELLKYRVNEILNSGGPITLSSALENYHSTQQLAIRFGVDISNYDTKVNEFLKEIK